MGEGRRAEVDPNQVLQSIQDFVDKHFEDVGVDFTKEALKIHYGESKKRNIKGTATSDEETLLKKEGVQFLKIPDRKTAAELRGEILQLPLIPTRAWFRMTSPKNCGLGFQGRSTS